MRRLWFRLRAMMRGWFGGNARDAELGEELQAFVEHDTESKMQSGMAPADARRAALIELGGAEQVTERVREGRAGAFLESLVKDAEYALRSLSQARGFSASVLGSLSLGLAATIVAFAFINGVLLRPIPGIRNQDRLVTLGVLETTPFVPRLLTTAMTDYPDVIRMLGDGMSSLEGLASFTLSDLAVTLPQPRSLEAAFVSANYFDVLGVQPEIGRAFAPEEGRVEPAFVAVISRALWTREFGGNPSVIGQAIQAGGQTLQIVGVAPGGFAGTTRGATPVEIWVPIALVDRVGGPVSVNRSGVVLFGEPLGRGRVVRFVGRMGDGVRVDRVETELRGVAGRMGAYGDVPVERLTVEVARLSRVDWGVAGPEAAIILTIPLLVLVIACINAANLLLVRASRRSREIAVRLALGASRSRVIRQLVIECLVLAIGAAVLALPLAWSGLQVLGAFVLFPMPLDGAVLTGTLITAFLTALAFGLIPGLQATHGLSAGALGTSPARSGGARADFRGRRLLVAVRIALSLGLLATTFQLTSALESLAEPPGTDPDRLLLASFDLAQLRFSSAESDAFYGALLDRTSQLPGVEAAGLSSPNLGGRWAPDFALAVLLDAGNGPVGGFTGGYAGGDFFEVVGLDLLQGRAFVSADRLEIPGVAIVTERVASQILNGDALGRSLRVSTLLGDAIDVQIVGIVQSPVRSSGEDVSAIFFPSPFPSAVQPGTARTLHIRSRGPAAALAPAVRDVVAGLNAQVPILELDTLDEKIRAEFQTERGLATVAAILGIVALLLASVGLYGVTSYSVALRAREIAVRMALGARTDRVVAMVLRQALAVVLVGSVLGGLVAIVAGLLIRAEVFGAAELDVSTFSGSAALLAVAMLFASILPARRAARTNPSHVLRGD